MSRRPTFHELIEKDIINNPDWLPYINGTGSMPVRQPETLKIIAQFFFYMADFFHAKEISNKISVILEDRASGARLETYKVLNLFESALYRSLAQKGNSAHQLWTQMVEQRRQIPDETLLQQRMANLWVYEAYALAKLERYVEISQPAEKGFAGINKGRATYRAPHRNSRVYGLVDVLIHLANCKIKSKETHHKEQAQRALHKFKKENLRYGRLGYDIIFDLQFSYPDVFEPILPSADPNND